MKGWFSIIMAFFSMVPACFAFSGFGICNFTKQKVPAVICYGPTLLEEATVVGDTKVAGPLKAHNVTTNNIIVTGSVYFENATVLGTTEVTGHFKAKNANFEHNLTLITDNVTLYSTNVNGNLIVTAEGTAPSVILECGTVITGDVRFPGAAGVVRLTEDSVVRGAIMNGKSLRIKVNCPPLPANANNAADASASTLTGMPGATNGDMPVPGAPTSLVPPSPHIKALTQHPDKLGVPVAKPSNPLVQQKQ